MRARPVYRSLTFRSGLIGIAFVSLAWILSWRFDSVAEWGRVRVGQGWGHVSLNVLTSSKPFNGHHLAIDQIDLPSHVFDIPALLRPEEVARDEYLIATFPETRFDSVRRLHEFNLFAQHVTGKHVTVLVVLIPHWLILMMTALPWVGLLYCRDRRIGRGHRLPEQENPAPQERGAG